MNLADLFTVTSLTASINKLPPMPSKIGYLGLFVEQGVTTSSVTIEEHHGRLFLIANTSVNDDAAPVKKNKRNRRTFTLSHLPTSDTILPAELQNIAPFGEETNVVQQQATIINNRLLDMHNSIAATREWYRMGALGGKILDADGGTLVDLYAEFGVTKKSINIAFSTPTTDVRKSCLDAKRWSETKLRVKESGARIAHYGPHLETGALSRPHIREQSTLSFPLTQGVCKTGGHIPGESESIKRTIYGKPLLASVKVFLVRRHISAYDNVDSR